MVCSSPGGPGTTLRSSTGPVEPSALAALRKPRSHAPAPRIAAFQRGGHIRLVFFSGEDPGRPGRRPSHRRRLLSLAAGESAAPDDRLPRTAPIMQSPSFQSRPTRSRRSRLRLGFRWEGLARGWRTALREFAIIVAGVLCALAAQSWWQAGEERRREQDYLRQLLADTRENERRPDAAIAVDSAAGSSVGRLAARCSAPRRCPPRTRWRPGSAAKPSPPPTSSRSPGATAPC